MARYVMYAPGCDASRCTTANSPKVRSTLLPFHKARRRATSNKSLPTSIGFSRAASMRGRSPDKPRNNASLVLIAPTSLRPCPRRHVAIVAADGGYRSSARAPALQERLAAGRKLLEFQFTFAAASGGGNIRVRRTEAIDHLVHRS